MSYSSNIISYFKDCYQADTRTLTLTNFFSAKVENKYVVEGEDELLNGHLPYLPVSEKYADEVDKNIALYKKEKEFYACAFFITGSSEGIEDKSHKICAPLFLFPASIVRQGDLSYLSIDYKKRQLNINFLSGLIKTGAQDVFREINQQIPRDKLSFESIGKLRRILESYLENFDGEEILSYPHFVTENSLKRSLQPKQLEKQRVFRLVCSMAFGVIKKSTNTMGIIGELESMAEHPKYSSPLSSLFSHGRPEKAEKLEEGYVPAVLNQSQQSIINSANHNSLTLVIGPPGTGKSYTIAALAIEFMSKGKSVLISSKTNQAVDVIANKIENDLGVRGVTTRAGRKGYHKELKSSLEGFLSSIRTRVIKPTKQWDEIYLLEKDLEAKSNMLKELEASFREDADKELEWAEFLAEKEGNSNWFISLKKSYINWRNGRKDPHWKHITDLFLLLEEQIILIQKHIELGFVIQVKKAITQHRKTFRKFVGAITARYSSKQEALFGEVDFSVLLQTFPIWLVNMAEIYEALPLEEEMFDLAIIDEATQCDIASSLPIFQRAKRVVVVGDPKQLRHLSFLSESVQSTLRKRHHLEEDELLLNYKNLSILDLVNNQIHDQEQVIFLNEHFRSNPDLIAFSNKQFYSDSMRIMTSVPSRRDLESIEITEIAGIRNSKGVNKEEAESVIEAVTKIVDSQHEVPAKLCHSIGILSPFRDQVDHLSYLLMREFNLNTIQKHRILCGTPYGFQGEERDIMFLSLTIDDNAHPTAVFHMNKPEVFNVSITRARSHQFIYRSFKHINASGELVSKYLSYSSERSEQFVPEHDDQFLQKVEARLDQLKIQYWPGYELAGMMVDLVLQVNGKYFGVNLIGYPGQFEDVLSIAELKILKRAGLPTFPLPYTYWYFDEQACFDELLKFVEYIEM